MEAETQSGAIGAAWFVRSIAVWGPGLLVMLADTDAGNVVTAAQGGAEWGYRLLPFIILLIPMLYMVQELTVRLGVATGLGHGELIRARFGPRRAWLAMLALARRRHRLAHHRVHRRRRRRRIVRPLAGFHASFRRGGAARHRRQRVVQAGRARRRSSSASSSSRSSSSPGPRIRGSRRWRGTRSTCPSAIAIFCSWPRRSSAPPSTRG